MDRQVSLLLLDSQLRLKNIQWVADHGSLELKVQLLHALEAEGR